MDLYKKDFVVIADAMRETVGGLPSNADVDRGAGSAIGALASVLAGSNAKFDGSRFIKACTPPGHEVVEETARYVYALKRSGGDHL